MLPVNVFGEPAQFFVDTGASLTNLDSSFQDQLGSPIRDANVKTGAGDMSFSLYVAPVIRIGDDSFVDEEPATCISLKNISEAYGAPVEGTIGMSYLKTHILQLDFDNGIAKIATELEHPVSSHSEPIRFDRRGTPRISLSVPDLGYHSFLIDTGANHVVNLDPEIYDALLIKGHVAALSSKSEAVIGQNVDRQSGVLRSLKLGPYTFFNVCVTRADVSAIGTRFLCRFNVTLDFPHKVAYFQPSRRYHDPDDRGRSGLGFTRKDGQTLVYCVEEDSPGDKGGIRAEDVLISLDGMPLSAYRLAQVHQRLCRRGENVRLVVERNGERHQISLTLSDEPDPFPESLPPNGAKPFPKSDKSP